MIEESQMRKAARHEAGHAVMRWLRYGAAGRITINRTNRQGEGYSRKGKHNGRGISFDAIQVSMAGMAAEMNYMGTWEQAAAMPGASDDASRVRDVVAVLCEVHPTIEAELETWFASVCRELKRHDGIIEKLAQRLVEHGAVSAAEATRLFEEWMDRKE